jgi:CheY-like chemotaxis protein
VRIVPAIAIMSTLAAVPLAGLTVWGTVRAGEAAAEAERLLAEEARAGYLAERVRSAVLDCRRYEQGMLLAVGLPSAVDAHLEAFLHMMYLAETAMDQYAAVAAELATSRGDQRPARTPEPWHCLLDERGTLKDYRERVLSTHAAILASGGSLSAQQADIELEPWKDRMRTVATNAGELGDWHSYRASQGVLAFSETLRRDQALAIRAGVASFALLAIGCGTILFPALRRARRLVDVAARLAEGSRAIDCRIGGKDELSEVGFALERLRIQLREHEEQLARRTLEARELAEAIGRSTLTTLIADRQGVIVWTTPNAASLRGRSLEEALSALGYAAEEIERAVTARSAGAAFSVERTRRGIGETLDAFHLDGYPVGDDRGGVLKHIVIERDASEAKRLERIRETNARLLAMIVGASHLTEALDALCRHLEGAIPGTSVSLLAVEDRKLRPIAGPSIPAAYNSLVDGIEIGPESGSCGRAALLGVPTIVGDILVEPCWAKYASVVEAFGFRSCWSVPCRSTDGEIIGTLSVYSSAPRMPTIPERELLLAATSLAGVAMSRHRSEQRAARRELELAEAIEERDRYRRDALAATRATSSDADDAFGELHRLMERAASSDAAEGSSRRSSDEMRDALHFLEDIVPSAGVGSPLSTSLGLGLSPMWEWAVPDLVIRDGVAASGASAVRFSFARRGTEALTGAVSLDAGRVRRAVTQQLRFLTGLGAGPIRIDVEQTGCDAAASLVITWTVESAPGRPVQQSWLAARCVERAGGTVATVPDELGRNRAVVMRFPIRTGRAAEAAVGVPSPSEQEIEGVTGRVLVVDDHADNRRLFATYLRRAGFEVEEATDGFEALRSIVERGEVDALDGVILDIQLPGMDGCQIARVVRAAEVDVAIVAATAHGTNSERDRCLAAGCDEVIAKPLTGDELLAAVRQAIRGRQMRRVASLG